MGIADDERMDSNLQRANKRIRELEEKVSSQRSGLGLLELHNSDLNKRIRQLEAEIERLTARLDFLTECYCSCNLTYDNYHFVCKLHEHKDGEVRLIGALAYNERLREGLRACIHALRSYQYGNGSPELAEEIAAASEKLLQDQK
jgi:uncharacterized coiled-coil protein SlyX